MSTNDDCELVQFKSSDDLHKFLTEKVDDITKVQLVVSSDIPMSRDGSEIIDESCSLFHTVSGRPFAINHQEFERLLNSGLLHRLGIPIQIQPRERR